MTNNILAQILAKLKGVKPSGSGWTALCPAHDDTRASFSIKAEGERVLLHCHAGCSIEQICAALGIKVSDLFTDKPQHSGQSARGRLGAVYNYFAADGKLLYQVCRRVPKGFFQRRPDGAGGWIDGLGGVTPVLYRLPELLRAVAAGEMVFIPEGEKDCQNLAKLGLAATTSPMGALKWRDHYAEPLRGARVIVLPDNDPPGRQHAEQVAQSLSGLAASVRLLELPNLAPKGDVSDWLLLGGTKDQLLKLANECPEWQAATPKERPSTKRTRRAKADEPHTRRTSFFVQGDTLLEQIHVDGKSLFIAYDGTTGQTTEVSGLELGNETIEPLDGADVALGAVKLPSCAMEYQSTPNLLADIVGHVHRYLDVSPRYEQFAAYYILLTWLFDRFHTLPYLRALGDTGCGKSRFLDVLGGLCYKSIVASGCVTPAPIYRMLRKWGGTLVLDEADMKNSDEYNEVVTILNCGFEKGRPVLRSTKDQPDNIQVLPVYGPKVFATRRRFKDVALEARCLTEIMHETDRQDIPPVLGKRFHGEQQLLRNKLLLFRLRNYAKIDPEVGANIDLGNIEPRLRQVSESFLALFAHEREVLANYQAFILGHQRELIEQRAATKEGQVVGVLFDLLGEQVFHVPSVPSAMGDRELGTGIAASDIAEKTGLTSQGVGAILKNLGLETKRMRQHGQNKRVIIYTPNKFDRLRKRYVLSDGGDALVPTSLSPIVLGTVGTVGTRDREQADDLLEVLI